tara:strand:- start:681 stop:1442 length:762 start_codon:yes stop_codon:yes gene_type:complete
MKKIKAYWVIGGALVISVFIVSSFGLLKNSFYYLFTTKDDISVTGSTSMDFTSDLIVWRASFSKKDTDLKTAYKKIKEDRSSINDFLLSKGVVSNDIIFKSIDLKKEYKYKSKYNVDGDKVDSEKIFSGYILTQELEISSNEVDLIEKISNEVTDLIEKNVFITSYQPRYYYTKLGELKIEMIKSAAQDGLLRATTAIEGGGGDLGELLETSIGVFQILGKNSNDEFSWGGTLNTLHKEKSAFVNVKQRFEIN